MLVIEFLPLRACDVVETDERLGRVGSDYVGRGRSALSTLFGRPRVEPGSVRDPKDRTGSRLDNLTPRASTQAIVGEKKEDACRRREYVVVYGGCHLVSSI